MNKLLFIVFYVLTICCYSQEESKLLKSIPNKQFEISLAGGASSPSSSYSDQSFASSGSFVEFTSSYFFSKLGISLILGQFSNPTEGNLAELTDQAAYPITNSTENWKISYYGVGPTFKTNFNKFEASINARVGSMSAKPISLLGSFESANADQSASVPVYSFGTEETSNTGFYTTGVRLGYKLDPSITFYIHSSYLSSFSDEIVLEEGRKQFVDINKDGVINEIDIIRADGTQVDFSYTSKNIKPETLNIGFGLTWSIGTEVKTRELLDFQKPDKTPKSTKERKPIQDVKSSQVKTKLNPQGKIVFTNLAKEKADKEKQQRKIITLTPKNNEQFSVESKLKNFSWSMVGERVMQPKYGVEISKMSSGNSVEWMLEGKTNGTKLSLEELFKQNSNFDRVSERLRHKDRAVFTDGRYRWKVTELSSGTSSTYSFFNFTNCEIDFSISNEEIECLGYEGDDRKYKICFDSTYLSSSGDLTYINASSGLTVYDQTYSPLSYTMVSPNPTLLTQIGATVSTVTYCFEVTVSSSVTSIGFGLQGDDLDPSPILCQPGVSSGFDELPDCLCDDCEEIELSFDDFSVALNGASGNQFNFNGNINVNVPIYGIEFQVQSYSYTATPSACTDGVTSIEESGMILMPGTTINGSTALQLANESVSGSASSNNNATKNIKYTSTSPLTGPIPVNLTIGLPGPLSGLDPSCCTIDYTVCIKVKVFYEESNCKSCVFTHCFEFNNQ